ncbi:MAG: hypothetical protein COB98_11465 [Flavobacteriaceae bacterium]|nr:MAG: hypothetical protein COB98_11465 [Flavobacteriaceae bacterium]
MEYNLGIGSRISHPSYGKGVVINIKTSGLKVTFIDHGLKEIPLNNDIEVIEEVLPDEDNVSFYDIETTLTNILKKWSDVSEIVPLGDKWTGGTMVLNPGDTSLQSKEIPIKTFFHKIIMLRDRIRVMEQKINASKTLSEEEKIDLEQYISRMYGSLTTFNVLFKNPSHKFTGSGKSAE